ncbi:MAG: hypothetical protein BGO01_05700 [Armatimonadetes bacterium 55-13]|nr:glycogen synthase [Armatimonadota bacterium]OJU61564.1 MAG: hypothetical protein BGO01_05700 [Armatimonadetes bacterium 55-13]
MGSKKSKSLNVLFVSVEVSPFAKVGGLADVAGSLPKALVERGHQVTIMMPAYKMVLDDPRWKIETIAEKIPVSMNPFWTVNAWVKETWLENVRVLLIGGDEFFQKSVSNDTIYYPGVEQYLFFSQALLAVSDRLELAPHVVHLNDWHTGLIPALMREKVKGHWNEVGTVFTIHNLAYQGEFGFEILDELELPHRLYNMHQLETWGRVNFLKAGCVFSDQVNTVSPNYAQEIQTPAYGCALDGLMRHLWAEGRLSGILNGIDIDFFNPSTDPAIPTHFSSQDLSGKQACKDGLRKELGLADIDAPLFGVVSRLSSQKGLDHVVAMANRFPKLPAQLIVQGLGDPWLAQELTKLSKKHPEHIRFVQKFDADLAQRVYAGCDGFLMPSAFEPCGLGQMIAMRYGTVPVVRKTGGLADTIFDGENGFVFEEGTPVELYATVHRAVDAYRDKTLWKKLMLAGMEIDLTWTKSAMDYEGVYYRAVEARKLDLAAAAS